MRYSARIERASGIRPVAVQCVSDRRHAGDDHHADHDRYDNELAVHHAPPSLPAVARVLARGASCFGSNSMPPQRDACRRRCVLDGRAVHFCPGEDRETCEWPRRSRRVRHAKRAPRTNQSSTVHELEITLLDVEPRIWRRFVVRSDTTLAKLHGRRPDRDGLEPTRTCTNSSRRTRARYSPPQPVATSPDWDEQISDARKARVADVLPAKGDQIVYEYDLRRRLGACHRGRRHSCFGAPARRCSRCLTRRTQLPRPKIAADRTATRSCWRPWPIQKHPEA